LVGTIPVNKLSASDRVRAQTATNFDDHGLLVSNRDRYLLSGW
jgi:hypothetical protein